MENKEERYLNVTLKNEENDKDEVVISLSGIFKKFKKYFIIWLVAAIVAGLLTVSFSGLTGADQYKSMTALVSFTFDGIENGKDPNGSVFDVHEIKSPSVIEAALTELGHPLTEVESIRQGITIEGIRPADAIDRITVYQSIYEGGTSGALSAAEKMLETSYYPTQFKVYFNYANTSFGDDEAVEVFNTVLECYRDYFFTTYGYNEALGSAVTALDYTDYDYAEAVDVFSSTLSTLRSYVNTLASEDTTRFRSSVTGYTFSDLSEAIKTLQNMDLDIISAYISLNNVTKDKENTKNYYNYRIEALERQKVVATENLATITDAINTYQKDTIQIFGNGTEGTDTISNIASDKYESLIQQRINTQDELSTTTQQIEYYKERLKKLNSTGTASEAEIERVETDLASLDEKIATLIDNVNKTADEFYNTVEFANAYNILVPASSSSVVRTISDVVKDSLVPLLVIEALLVVVYIGVAFVTAIIAENKKKNAAAVSAEPEAKEETKEKAEKKK